MRHLRITEIRPTRAPAPIAPRRKPYDWATERDHPYTTVDRTVARYALGILAATPAPDYPQAHDDAVRALTLAVTR